MDARLRGTEGRMAADGGTVYRATLDRRLRVKERMALLDHVRRLRDRPRRFTVEFDQRTDVLTIVVDRPEVLDYVVPNVVENLEAAIAAVDGRQVKLVDLTEVERCPACEGVLSRETLPCPDGLDGCLVVHLRQRCQSCGWPDTNGQAAAGPPGYVVITYWPNEAAGAVKQALVELAALTDQQAAEQIDEVVRGGMIYLELPTVEAARRLATAVAGLGALVEFGQAAS